MRRLDDRVTEVERVNARLEEAALNMARALGEVSRRWDAVYEAMRRVESADEQGSVERETRRGQGASGSRVSTRGPRRLRARQVGPSVRASRSS
jgi:hypothetical protein